MRDTWNDTNHYKNSNMHGKGIGTELSHNTTFSPSSDSST